MDDLFRKAKEAKNEKMKLKDLNDKKLKKQLLEEAERLRKMKEEDHIRILII